MQPDKDTTSALSNGLPLALDIKKRYVTAMIEKAVSDGKNYVECAVGDELATDLRKNGFWVQQWRNNVKSRVSW
jgi:hypothetical protein